MPKDESKEVILCEKCNNIITIINGRCEGFSANSKGIILIEEKVENEPITCYFCEKKICPKCTFFNEHALPYCINCEEVSNKYVKENIDTRKLNVLHAMDEINKGANE